jgi:hypothetical protein
MNIAAVSSINMNAVSNNAKIGTDKKAKPQAIQKEVSTLNSGTALRSYFMGGQALSFGFNCNTGDFVTKEIEDVPCCCCCGTMMLDSEPLARHLGEYKGAELSEEIKEHRDYFRNDQGTVAMMIAKEAELSNCDAAKAVKNIKPQFMPKLKDYCQDVLSATDEIAKTRLGEENPVSQIITKEKENVSKGKIDRVQFTEKLVGLHNKGKIDEESWDKIINTAMQLPQTANTAQKMFNKLGGRSNVGVFNDLLFESGQTIEHVHPHSRGGKNDTDNYLAECGECNHKRGNVSYLTWLKIHPEYPVNAQKHIEWFQQQQIDGQIGKEYDDYGTKIKATLSKESNGIMELKVLDKSKIEEFRARREAGEEISVHDEIQKQEEQEQEQA